MEGRGGKENGWREEEATRMNSCGNDVWEQTSLTQLSILCERCFAFCVNDGRGGGGRDTRGGKKYEAGRRIRGKQYKLYPQLGVSGRDGGGDKEE